MDMTTETLYHTEVGLPAWFRAPQHTVNVIYSNHAKREAQRDRYGSIPLYPSICLANYDVVEVGVIDGKVSKIVFRGSLDEYRDICIVLIPCPGKPWFCKTTWANEKNDLHRTLDRTRYAAA